MYTRGNWAKAIVAATPHLLFALLFVVHQWNNIACLLITFASIIGVVAYGWRRNKPVWFFPWLGYALIPLLIVGFILATLIIEALSSNNLAFSWFWLAALAYLPIALWLLISITTQTVRREWLLAPLMALPIPAVTGWFLVMQGQGSLLRFGEQYHNLDSWIALCLLALAGVVILFIRLPQRSLKASVLLSAGLATLSIVAISSQGSLGILSLATLVLATPALLLGPALLERWIGHGEQKAEAWWGYCWFEHVCLSRRHH